jgi:hypothetical protein
MTIDKTKIFNPKAVKCWVSGFGGGNPVSSEKMLEREAALRKKKKSQTKNTPE